MEDSDDEILLRRRKKRKRENEESLSPSREKEKGEEEKDEGKDIKATLSPQIQERILANKQIAMEKLRLKKLKEIQEREIHESEKAFFNDEEEETNMIENNVMENIEEEMEKEEEYVLPIKCEVCESPTIDQLLFETFKVHACMMCKGKDQFKLAPKTKLLEGYLLTEKDIKELSFLTKKINNTKYGLGSEMKLYMVSQVIKISMNKWGSEAKMEEEREKREKEKLKKKARKAEKKSRDTNNSFGVSSLSSNILMQVGDEKKSKTLINLMKSNTKHIHVFNSKHVLNEETDVWTKTCDECGFSVEYESF